MMLKINKYLYLWTEHISFWLLPVLRLGFPDCILQSLASEVSDHCTLLLGLREGVQGKRRFHFESFWTKLDGFHEMVSASWHDRDHCFVSSRTDLSQAQTVDKSPTVMESMTSGPHKLATCCCVRDITSPEIARDVRGLTTEEKWLLGEATRCCLVLASLQRTVARLLSRICVLKDGDANTSLFHQQAGFWKKNNFIPKLVGGEGKQQIMFEYYENLLGTTLPRASTLNLPFFHHHGIDLNALDNPITEEEAL